MIRFRHLLHPLRSGRSGYRRATAAMARWHRARAFRDIARAERDRCWCGGELRSFSWHPSYGVCAHCGCYVNRPPTQSKQMERLYSFDLYWHSRQRLKGHPPIEDRPASDRSDGRIDVWLGLIARFAPLQATAIEVGCAHGELLAELRSRGYRCLGVEPDETTARWVRNRTGLDVRVGFFPHLQLPPCDLFLAFDVLEHSPDPLVFLRGVTGILKGGGIAIIQTPIDRYELEPPFGEQFSKAFDDLEHLFLFTDKAIGELAQRSGLRVIDNTERLWLHHEICVLRNP